MDVLSRLRQFTLSFCSEPSIRVGKITQPLQLLAGPAVIRLSETAVIPPAPECYSPISQDLPRMNHAAQDKLLPKVFREIAL